MASHHKEKTEVSRASRSTTPSPAMTPTPITPSSGRRSRIRTPSNELSDLTKSSPGQPSHAIAASAGQRSHKSSPLKAQSRFTTPSPGQNPSNLTIPPEYSPLNTSTHETLTPEQQSFLICHAPLCRNNAELSHRFTTLFPSTKHTPDSINLFIQALPDENSPEYRCLPQAACANLWKKYDIPTPSASSEHLGTAAWSAEQRAFLAVHRSRGVELVPLIANFKRRFGEKAQRSETQIRSAITIIMRDKELVRQLGDLAGRYEWFVSESELGKKEKERMTRWRSMEEGRERLREGRERWVVAVRDASADSSSSRSNKMEGTTRANAICLSDSESGSPRKLGEKYVKSSPARDSKAKNRPDAGSPTSKKYANMLSPSLPLRLKKAPDPRSASPRKDEGGKDWDPVRERYRR